MSSQTRPKVNDVVECQARYPHQVKEHKKLVHKNVESVVVNGGNLGRKLNLWRREKLI